MQIDVTPEVILSQLGIAKSDSAFSQVEKAIKNTNNFDKFAKHLIHLNDELKHLKAYIALSNSQDYFKIKCDQIDSENILEEFHTIIEKFSKKYNVELKQVPNKEVFYILGVK
jgi:oligoendopeptidase F